MESDKAFLLVLVVLAGLLAALVVLPFLQYVLLAVLLGYVLRPAQKRLAPAVGGGVSAGALILVATVAVVVPTAVLLSIVVEEALGVLAAVREGRIDLDGLQPVLGTDLVAAIRTGGPERGRSLLFAAVDAFGSVTTAVIGLTVLAFLLYYLLKDGDRFARWVRVVSPLPPAVEAELATEFDRLMWAVVVANVFVAVVQGVLTGLGLAVVRFPNAVFWTVVTTLLSLLPLVGASVVWLPAAGYLFLTGRVVAAAFLFVYGALVVSVSDNYLRPVVTGRGAGVNPGVLALGIFGGLATAGFMGVFFGPVVLGLFRVVVEVFAREYLPGSRAGLVGPR